MTHAQPTYGNTAQGAATPLEAVRRLHSEAAGLLEAPLDAGATIFERFEGTRRVAAYRVQIVPGTQGGWLLTEEAFSAPCGDTPSNEEPRLG